MAHIPVVKKVKLQTLTLPTAWQTVIFRNYGYVRVERIAKTLGCDEETIRVEAKRLGLPDDDFVADFEKRGYLTIIRNNWHLLPYPQLLTLLNFGMNPVESKISLSKITFSRLSQSRNA